MAQAAIPSSNAFGPSSGGGLFSGMPAIVQQAELLLTEAPKLLEEALQSALMNADKEAKEKLFRESGNTAVEVSFDSEEQVVIFTYTDSSLVDSEYGGPDQVPTGFLRKFALTKSQDIADDVSRKLRF